MPSRTLEKKFEELEDDKESQEQLAQDIIAIQESDMRSNMARKFVHYYFGIMSLIIIGVPVYNYLMSRADKAALAISIKDALLTYSAVVGPTIGLVVAYYFKSDKNGN